MKKVYFLLLFFPITLFADCVSDLSCCPSPDKEPLSYGGIPKGWQVHPMLDRPQGDVGAVFDKAIISTFSGMTAGVTCKYDYGSGSYAIFLPARTAISDKRYRPWSRIYAGYQCSRDREQCRFVIND
jgi:hypothetical protein